MTLNQGDFVQVSYTGRISETKAIFDTTDKTVAESNNIAQKNKSYGPITICIGEGQILTGIDESLVGKKESETYSIKIPPEKAFGKKDSKYIKLIPMQKFKEQKINPVPGLTVYINEQMGFVKTVSGGRVLVDFNHPFSGKTVEYDVIVDKHVTDTAAKINAVLALGKVTDGSAKVEGDKATITLKNPMPQQMTKVIETHVKHLVKEVKEITFDIPKDFEASKKN